MITRHFENLRLIKFNIDIKGGGLLGLYGIILLKHHFGNSIDISCCDIDEGKQDVIARLGATFIKGILL